MIQELLPQIISTVIILLMALVLRFVIVKIIRKYATISAKIEPKTNHIIRICSIFINLTCLLTLITIWGVDPHNVFVALSSIFAIIGVAFFAQWSVLSNITAGIILFFTSPFRVGDYIRILDKDIPLEARIEDIYSFYTHLRTKDGCLHIFPNTLMLQKGISIIKEADNEEDKTSTFNNSF